MQEEIKKTIGDIKEIVAERFYSPMYFYFIIAWIITNWKFVYVFLFSNEGFLFGSVHLLKIDYLLSFYPVNNYFDLFYNISVLLLIPAFFSYLAVWWFTIMSEVFYKKYETHKQNKRVIQRELEYTEKVRFAKVEREVRDIESDKNNIKYEDNKEFNETLDVSNEMVAVNGIMMNPSEVLYRNDYEAYKEALREWVEAQHSGDGLTDEQRERAIKDYQEEMRGEQQYTEWKDKDR